MAWHGKAYPGAMRDQKADKRREAEERHLRAEARQMVEDFVAVMGISRRDAEQALDKALSGPTEPLQVTGP